MYVCMHACMYVRMYVCSYVCIYVCMYVFMYVHLFIETDVQIDMNGTIHTHRQLNINSYQYVCIHRYTPRKMNSHGKLFLYHNCEAVKGKWKLDLGRCIKLFL